jgi:HAMP domain-containing protein
VPPAVESFAATDMRFALDWLDGYIEDTGADIAGALEALNGWAARVLEEQVADLRARGHELEAGQWRNHRTPKGREELQETALMIRKLLDEHKTG